MNCEMQYSGGEYFAGRLRAIEIIFFCYNTQQFIECSLVVLLGKGQLVSLQTLAQNPK